MIRLLSLLFLCMPMVFATSTELWRENQPSSIEEVDHQPWQTFLDQYLAFDDFGQSYFRYDAVTQTEHAKLNGYIARLSAMNPLTLNSSEQKAYWINLYNALTVNLVLDNYPVKSIRQIGGKLGGLIPTGPWKEEIITINNERLSLDDIEHSIVRPIFQDARIHYALNCAAKGCPNLAAQAYTGATVDAQLSAAESRFINHPRGVRLQNGKLILSKIYDWYGEDFAQDDKGLLLYLAKHAEPKLRAQNQGYSGRLSYEYDWALNQEPKP